jgi:hypothetical protein
MNRKIRHTFVRPSWQCAGCGEAWPCADRRRRLLARYQGEALRLDLRAMLGTWMGVQLVEADPLPQRGRRRRSGLVAQGREQDVLDEVGGGLRVDGLALQHDAAKRGGRDDAGQQGGRGR